MSTIGVYVHVPFCVRKCPYCDFYSVPYSEALAARYTDAVVRAIETQPFGPLAADTLYFGGGTPALLGSDRLHRVLSAASRAFRPDISAEMTLEANPGDVKHKDFTQLRQMGFNRVSFGVQSLNDAELGILGRRHGAREASRAILTAKEAGFDDISADLMLAVPGQTRESLAETVGELAALPVSHISAYLLKIEEGTPFAAKQNALALPDEDEAAERYLDCVQLLKCHGFRQYEISNFARDGRISRHNTRYWRCGEYLGIGPAAHSFLQGRRFCFPRELEAFLTAERPFGLTVDDGPGGGFEEELMLALRLTEGYDLSRASPAKAGRMLAKARELQKNGLAEVAGGRVSLTPEGFLLSNSIIRMLLDAAGA